MRNISIISIICILHLYNNGIAQNCPVKPTLIEKEVVFIESPDPLLSPIMDTDGDGVPDEQEELPFADCDNDGFPNYMDIDSDNDGIGDLLDQCDCAPYPNSDTGCPPEITDRLVYWIHGYKGSENSFLPVSEDVQSNFKVNSHRPDYNASQESFEASRSNVEIDIRDITRGLTNTHRNFIIGHSLGGLVSRKLGVLTNEFNDVPLYNGLITFGTPHHGADIADIAVHTPLVIQYALDDACENMSKGPLNEIVGTYFWTKILTTLGLVDLGIGYSCDFLSSTGFDFVESFVSTGIEEELTTESVLNLPPMATAHNAVFYGIEDEFNEGTLFPRFLGSILPNTGIEYATYEEGNSDDIGLVTYTNFLEWYYDRYIYWDNQKPGAWGWTFNPFSALLSNARVIRIRNGYQDGFNFLNRVNDVWKRLIGAGRITNIEYGPSDFECNCYIETPYGDQWVSRGSSIDPNECSDHEDQLNSSGQYQDPVYCYVEEIERLIYTFADSESDGFILAESAKNGPGANYEVQYMQGSGHIQMKNDDNMKDAIDAIFLNGLGKKFFETDEK